MIDGTITGSFLSIISFMGVEERPGIAAAPCGSIPFMDVFYLLLKAGAPICHIPLVNVGNRVLITAPFLGSISYMTVVDICHHHLGRTGRRAG